MNLFRQKLDEVTRSLLPVIALVLLVSLTLIRVEGEVLWRFLIGGALLLIGLAVFLLGVDLAMNPIGARMAEELATSRTAVKIGVFSFLLGFLVTVAEPDLLILGEQVESASGGAINAFFMVYMVSTGVGILVALGTFRLLSGKLSFALFMALAYGLILILSSFAREEYLAIAFDSSGATTGALTTPFVLALSASLSRLKGGQNAERDTFGMVGVMSAGPIFAVTLMSIFSGQREFRGGAETFLPASGILAPILRGLPGVVRESVIALLPLTVLFFFLNAIRFKAPRQEIGGIIKGLLYTLLGFVVFLSGVYSGFMDMGQVLGREIAARHHWLLPVLGFLLGMIVVLVEPAVHVLGHQIEEATGGRIPLKLIRLTLSLGVGLAIAASMLRIMFPQVKLWFFLLPGFLAAVLLSFRSDPVFVGIAYDAGGVASGPITATFVLAFAQGAAAMTPTADVMADGFGVIAMVAMAPVLSINLLGAVFRRKEERLPGAAASVARAKPAALPGKIEFYDCLVAIVNRGLAQRAVEISREAGAGGATILHGRGSGTHDMRLFHMEIQKEKEVIFWLTDARISDAIAARLYEELDLGGEGGGTVFVFPSGAYGLDAPMAIGLGEEEGPKKTGLSPGASTAQEVLPPGGED